MADAQELMLMAYRESWGDIVDPRDGPYFDDISSSYQRQQHATMRRDRMDGRFLPVYDNEVDLAIIRAMSRLMHERVPMAKARTRRLMDYTISRGFDWTVAHEDKELGKELSLVVKRFFDDNKFTVILERESYEAECIDGEWLAELAVDDGQICLNLMVSDNLVEPSNTSQLDEWLDVDFVSSWSFGVLSKLYSPNRPKGYHIVRDIGGTDWDFIPESRFLHWKKNTPEIAKRGFGDSYTTHVYLGRADKVLANTAEGAAVQAAIAYICEHVAGTSSTQAQNVVANLLNRTTRDPVTGAVVRSKKIVPGQRVDIPSGMKYHAGLFGSNNSQIYIQVMESLIRLSGIVDAMPEHFLTGSAENNNHASALVAESPFVQGRLAEQTLRKQRLKCLIEKVLRLACTVGLLKGYTWKEIEPGLKVTIQEPSIVTRDPVALTQALSQQMELKLISKRSASQQLGLDYEQEQENIVKETPAATPVAATLPAVVGDPKPPTLPTGDGAVKVTEATKLKEAKDADGDGLINDGKPNEQPAPVKVPKSDGKYTQSGNTKKISKAKQSSTGPFVGGKRHVTVEQFATHDEMKSVLGDALSKSPTLDESEIAARIEAVNRVVSKMPKAAVQHVGSTLKIVTSCSGLGDVGEQYSDMTGDKIEADDVIGGLWSTKSGRLTVDGGFEDEGYEDEGATMTKQGILAHEIGHILDTSGGKFNRSKSAEFVKAFRSEMAGGQLSDYATTDEQEGFAEFARLIYASESNHDEIEKSFPLTTAFFRNQGLM